MHKPKGIIDHKAAMDNGLWPNIVCSICHGFLHVMIVRDRNLGPMAYLRHNPKGKEVK